MAMIGSTDLVFTNSSQKLSDIASDIKITPVEKQALQREWVKISTEYPTIVAQAGVYSITTELTDFVDSYNDLKAYIAPLLDDLTTTNDIVGNDLRDLLQSYYDSRAVLQKAITDAAKRLADEARNFGNAAIESANGKNTNYYGHDQPSDPKEGDIWFVYDSNNNIIAIRHYDGSKWVTDVDNASLAQHISEAEAAAANAESVGAAAQQTASNVQTAVEQAQSNASVAIQAANNAVESANSANSKISLMQNSIDGISTKITQMGDDINIRVKKDDIINQINISTESILISGSKIHITGSTYIDNAVIKDAMIDTVSANKLTAGTIDASIITVKNVNASNITTGTLASARIASKSITVDKLDVTNLSAISANLGNVTAGNITGVTMSLANGKFIVDSSGNVTFGGALNGATGTFNGDLVVKNPSGNTIVSIKKQTYGGTVSIFDQNGNLDAKLGSETGSGGNYGGTLILYNHSSGKQRVGISISSSDYGIINLSDANNKVRIVAYADTSIPRIGILDSDGQLQTYLRPEFGVINNETIATQPWVEEYLDTYGYAKNGDSSYAATILKANSVDINTATHIYIRPSSGGEVRCTVTGTTEQYVSLHASNVSVSSLEKYKQDIKLFTGSAMDIINNSDIYTFMLKEDVKNGRGKTKFGVVIGNGYKTPPELLNFEEDAVEQYVMNSLSFKGLQEHDKQIREIKEYVKEIKELKERIEILEGMIA